MATSNKLKIKVRVGDKLYPMTIDRGEEQSIRAAADKVTEMYKRFASKITEPIDRMAFVAFEMASRNETNSLGKELNNLVNEIDKICDKIDNSLNETN